MRTERRDVESLRSKECDYALMPGQHFCETPKFWELWQDEPPRRLKRWRKVRIFWVILKEGRLVR